MAKGVNKVILVGNLGSDPDVRYSAGGSAIARFSVATSENWVDKQSGERQERTEWHRVVAFGKLAEICGEYLAKGRQVYLEGQLRTEKYTGKDGVERYSTDVIAQEVQFLGSGEGGHGDGQGRGQGSSQGGGRSAYGGGRGQGGRQVDERQREERPASSGSTAGGDFADDEIPF